MPQYSQRFTAEGVGEFPYDMLRYDSCYPDTEQDSALLGKPYPQDRTERRSVRLRRVVPMAKALPTFARWASFGWTVYTETVVTRKI
jgi:hypothetical protein